MTDKAVHFVEGVGWRYDSDHSMTQRMELHDYHGRSVYMITIDLADRSVARLGTLCRRDNGQAIVELSALGRRVRDCWNQIAARHAGVRSLALQIMPDHLHGVLFVMREQQLHLGKIIAGFKTGCSHAWWEIEPEVVAAAGAGAAAPGAGPAAPGAGPAAPEAGLAAPEAGPLSAPNYNSANTTAQTREQLQEGAMQPMPNSKGAMPNSKGTMPRSKGAKGPSLFSPGYHDSVLMGRGQLQNMLRYVADNPRRAMIKREHPDLFRIVSDVQVGGRTFAAIGNQWLLDRPMRLQVRCHNNTSPENLQLIARQKAFFLRRGREGAVIVSPCISPGEKEIARAALEAHQPLIVILENGFPPLYKPPGRYFEACADGSLLMLAPWPYHTERRTITRWQCESLNAMAAEISTDPWDADSEWKLKSCGHIP